MTPHALVTWLPLLPLVLGVLGLLRVASGAHVVRTIGRRISTRRAKKRGEGVARVKGRVVRLDGQPEGVLKEGPCALVRFTLKHGPSTLVSYAEQGPLKLSDKRGLVELHWARRTVLLPDRFVIEGGLDDPPPGLVRTLYQRFDYDAPGIKDGRGYRFREVAVRPGDVVEAVGTLRQRAGKLVLGAGRFPLVVGGEGARLTGPMWRRLGAELVASGALAAAGGAWAWRVGTVTMLVDEVRGALGGAP